MKLNLSIAITVLAITVLTITGVAVMLTRCNGFFARTFSRSPAELYGVKQENQTEVLAAADVPSAVAQAVKDTLAAATKTWVSSGRLEFWVLGTDRAAAVDLAAAFCERRVARGDMSERDCLEDSENKDHGFLMYQAIGAEALASGNPRMDAAHNGGAEWGIHRMASSLPLGFAGFLGIAGEGDQITILHEYWHSVQMSFMQPGDHGPNQEVAGPVWFIEGSAVAMAEFTSSKLLASGELRQWNNAVRPWPNLRERMEAKMKLVQRLKQGCSSYLPDAYGGECGQLAYEGGAWAVAYLMHKFGEDVLLRSFHPNVQRLGWEQCFQKTFGQSSNDFRAEFAVFMQKPIAEQLEILPKY